MFKQYFVYMMTGWNDKVLYVGVTGDLIRRVYEHKSKEIQGFTSKYNLDKLVYYEDFRDVKQAIEREKQLKGWTRQKKNELVNSFNPEWKDLSMLLK